MDDAPVARSQVIRRAAAGKSSWSEEISSVATRLRCATSRVNEAVIKYGVRIGHATQPVARGAWVHLHNLASDLDERSGTLDLHSGAPTDTASAYV